MLIEIAALCYGATQLKNTPNKHWAKTPAVLALQALVWMVIKIGVNFALMRELAGEDLSGDIAIGVLAFINAVFYALSFFICRWIWNKAHRATPARIEPAMVVFWVAVITVLAFVLAGL
ncbi:hypothetical protein [Agarivorans sp. JK6]|uniref:hypothetical protein n=1 Tax=Agarivorans sp. JK6 TaxID=2997426 RepID=UPI0038730333